MIEAAIDIGTNTMLMLIAEVGPATKPGAPRQLIKVINDQMTFVRLGQDVHQKRSFISAAMDRARLCFKNYKKICDQANVERIYAVATSASRDAQNAEEFYDQIREEIGIEVQIIAGQTEARLTFLGGLLPFQDPSRAAVLDIGGGSTEFVTMNQGMVSGQSIDMGCVRATEMFLKGDPYSRASLEEMNAKLKLTWKSLDSDLQKELRTKEWTAVAGTPTTLAAIHQNLAHFVPERVDGYRLDRRSVGDSFESLALQTQAQRAANPLMGVGRGDIMVAGVSILYTAMEVFEKEAVVVSSRGLRHGTLLYPNLLDL